MPTATDFAWTFPWGEFVGGFNAFGQMLGTPVALAAALLVAFAFAAFVIGLVRKARSR